MVVIRICAGKHDYKVPVYQEQFALLPKHKRHHRAPFMFIYKLILFNYHTSSYCLIGSFIHQDE